MPRPVEVSDEPPELAELGLRPFDARSVALSVLLGLPDPVLPARSLVHLGELFGLAPGTMRTALSRMVGRGELVGDAGSYRLGPAHEGRRRTQRAGWRPAPAWDGTWWIITAEPGQTAAARRARRAALTAARFAPWRAEVWMRPANLPRPDLPDDGTVVVRGSLDATDDLELSHRLWPLGQIAATARQVLAVLDSPRGDLTAAAPAQLPGAIVVAAAAVRALRQDPLLPARLTPEPWPLDDLRERYRAYDRQLGQLLRTAISAS